MVPVVSRDHDDDVIRSSFRSEFIKLFDDISRLGEDGGNEETTLRDTDQSRQLEYVVWTDGTGDAPASESAAAQSDKRTLSSHNGQDATDASYSDQKTAPSRPSSPPNKTNGMMSADKGQIACSGEKFFSRQNNDAEVDTQLDSLTQSPNASSQLRSADSGTVDETPRVGETALRNVGGPRELSSSECGLQSHRSHDETASNSDWVAVTEDSGTLLQHQSESDRPLLAADEACISVNPAQPDGVVVVEERSFRPVTGSLDSETHCVPTAADNCTDGMPPDQSYRLRVSEFQTAEQTCRLDERRVGNEAVLSRNRQLQSGWKKIHTRGKQSELEECDQTSSSDDDDHVTFENSSSVSCCRAPSSTTFTDDHAASSYDYECLPSFTRACSAAEAEEMSLSTADASCSVALKNSHRCTSGEEDTDIDVANVAKRSCDWKTRLMEALEGFLPQRLGDATELEEISSRSASFSNSSFDSLDAINDQNGCQLNSVTAEVTYVDHGKQTDAEQTALLSTSSSSSSSAAAAASSSLLNSSVNNWAATEAPDVDEKAAPSCVNSLPIDADVQTLSCLSSTTPSLSSSGQMKTIEVASCELEHSCYRQQDWATTSMREDAVVSGADSLEAPSPSPHVNDAEYFELGECAEELANDSCEPESANEAVTVKHLDEYDDSGHAPPLRTGTAASQAHERPDAAEEIDNVENCPSARQRTNGVEEDLASAQPTSSLLTVSVTERAESELRTLHASFKNSRKYAEACTDSRVRNNSSSAVTTKSEDQKQHSTKEKQVDTDRQDCVNVRRRDWAVEHDRRETITAEMKNGDINEILPLLFLTAKSLSDDDYELNYHFGSHFEGRATETERRDAGDYRRNFATISTLHVQSTAARDRPVVSTRSASERKDTGCGPTLRATDGEGSRTTVVTDMSVDALPVRSRKTERPTSLVARVNKKCNIVIKPDSNNYETECASASEESNSMAAYDGVNCGASAGVDDRTSEKVAYPRANKTCGEPEHHDSKSRFGGNDMSRRLPEPEARESRSRGQNHFGNDSFSFFGLTLATSPTAEEKRERVSAAENVAYNIHNSDAANETSYCDRHRNDNYFSLEDRRKERAKRQLNALLTPLCQNPKAPSDVIRTAPKARTTADWKEIPTTRGSPPPDDVISDVTYSQNSGRRSLSLLSTFSHRNTGTNSQTSVFHDDNNNDKQVADRDVFKMASPTTTAIGGDDASSWQRQHTRGPHSVKILISSTGHPSSPSFRQQNQPRFFQDDVGYRDDTTSTWSPLNRLRADAYQRSLSQPVVDRSEAFIMSSTEVRHRDRVKLPRAAAGRRSTQLSPPTRLGPARPAISSVGEQYQFQYHG